MRLGLIILTLTTLTFYSTFGQGLSQPIFSTTELKKGFYKNFSEFVMNNPSIPFDDEKMEFEENQELLIDNITGGIFVLHGTEIKLPIFRLQYKKTKKRVNTKSLWGYCDGSKVFINSYTHIPRHFFVELLLIGRYCYFIQVGSVSNFQPTNKLITPFNSHRDAEEYIINVNNGKIFNLDKTLLRTILESDKELLEELNSDKQAKRKLLLDYIKKYNDRHPDQITVLK